MIYLKYRNNILSMLITNPTIAHYNSNRNLVISVDKLSIDDLQEIINIANTKLQQAINDEIIKIGNYANESDYRRSR